MLGFFIRTFDTLDREWASAFIAWRWGADTVVTHETVYHPATLPGFIAIRQNENLGLVTYHIERRDCEIVTLDSVLENNGIGSALIESVKEVAQQARCQRLWLITTNDNLHALGFYQRRGFVIAAVHVNAIERDRLLKPEIPRFGMDRIPIRDEIELELVL